MDVPPEIEVGDQCPQPFACAFCNHYWKDVTQPEDPFGMLPRLVQAAHVTDEVYFNKAYAREQLMSHTGPAYLLDFETIMFAVPVWKGSRPYQNLPFQYSLHRVDPDGTLHHMKFLDLSGGDPRRALSEQMIAECGKEGAIFVCNAGFERRILADLAACYSDLRPSFEALMHRIVDLYPIVRDCYYNPLQNGSWSLKAVAPAIAPEPSYGELEGVQGGSDAGIALQEACHPETTGEHREPLRKELLEY